MDKEGFKRIEQLLSSQDIELAQLGAKILQDQVHESEWGKILGRNISRGFVWEIRDREITVRKRRGIWEQ